MHLNVRLEMKKWESQAFTLFVWHTIFCGVSGSLLFLSPWAHKPGAIHPILVIPFFYLLLSAVPYSVAVALGVSEIRKKMKFGLSAISAILSSLILILAFAFLRSRWDSIMSV